MVAAVTSVTASAAVTAAATGLPLQPGTVVDAKVVQILQPDLVRIALQGVLIDALSEVPLQAGQSLKLAVSQTLQGAVRLSTLPAETASTQTAARPTTVSGPPLVPVAPEAQAIAFATQTAATRQSGLSQLFANLTVAANSDALPEAVQQAAVKIIALRSPLDQSISGPRLQQAVAASGIFREAALAQGPTPAVIPDLKSALIVLRQTLSVALGGASDALPTSPPATQAVATSQPLPSLPARTASPIVIVGTDASPQTVIDDDAIPARLRSHGETLALLAAQSGGRSGFASSNSAGTDPLSELVRGLLTQSEVNRPDAARLTQLNSTSQPASESDIARTNIPPPPFRGSAPSAQSVAPSTIAADTPAAVAAKQLHDDTEGAIARQTLLQIASLPDRLDMPGAKSDVTQSRWAFEIPFSTPQGTAVAQFEIARDGSGNNEAASAKRVWRARFSLDVEPAGPVHAIVSLAGEVTSVRMWAERPLTAARLRAGSSELAAALQSAALQPGDIVIGEGAPPQSPAAPAGHFIDRAS